MELSQELTSYADVAISATTNGSRLSVPHIRQQILSCFSELTISIDGPAVIHDQLRGVPGVFEKTENAVRQLVAERAKTNETLKIRVNSILMRRTVPHLVELCRTLADWGVDEITFNQLGGRDRPEFFPTNGLRAEDVTHLRSIVPGLVSELADRGVVLCANDLYLERIAASSRGETLPVIDCKPGETFYSVSYTHLTLPTIYSV